MRYKVYCEVLFCLDHMIICSYHLSPQKTLLTDRVKVGLNEEKCSGGDKGTLGLAEIFRYMG